MKWNWQQPDWPSFTWSPSRLAFSEERFLFSAGLLLGTVNHLTDEDRIRFTVEIMSDEAVTTSEIEGEFLNRASVQSSIGRHFGFTMGSRGGSPSERGIADLMVNLHRSISSELSHDTLFEWHRMVMRGRRDLFDAGSIELRKNPCR